MSQSPNASMTLSPGDLKMVRLLRGRLRLRSDVDVIRRALRLLRGTTDRDEAYRTGSRVTRRSTDEAIRSLDLGIVPPLTLE